MIINRNKRKYSCKQDAIQIQCAKYNTQFLETTASNLCKVQIYVNLLRLVLLNFLFSLCVRGCGKEVRGMETEKGDDMYEEKMKCDIENASELLMRLRFAVCFS